MKLKFKPSRKPIKISFFKPIKLNTSKSVRKVPLKNLTWPQASIRFPRLNPFGDTDKDGKLNMFDCRPFDRRRHGKLEREEIRTNYGIQKKPTRFQKHIIRIIEKDPTLNRELKGVKITTNTDDFAGKYSVNFKNLDEAINLNPNRYYKGYAAEEDVSLKQAIIHEQKHRERAQDILKSNITPKEKSKRFIERFRDEIGGEGTGIYQTNVIEENEAVRAQRAPTSIDIIRAKKRDILQQEGSTPETLSRFEPEPIIDSLEAFKKHSKEQRAKSRAQDKEDDRIISSRDPIKIKEMQERWEKTKQESIEADTKFREDNKEKLEKMATRQAKKDEIESLEQDRILAKYKHDSAEDIDIKPIHKDED